MKKEDFALICMLLLLIVSNISDVTWIEISVGLLSVFWGAYYVYHLIKGEDER